MVKKTRKTLAFLLVALLVFILTPMAAFAAPIIEDPIPESIPAWTVGLSITPTIDVSPYVSGATGTVTYSSSTLPAGITINPSTGVISGTPTTVTSAGTATITVTDSDDASNPSTASISFGAISAAMAFIISSSIPTSVVGTAITSIDVSTMVTGGTGTRTFSSSTLPAGLSISSAGLISGTPTTAGAGGTATITVTDSVGATATSTISYGAITLPLTFTYSASFDIPASTVGVSITTIDVATGASGGTTPYTFTATGLPAGISISTAGVISGAPMTAGSAGTATITVAGSSPSTPASANITINYGIISAAPTPSISVTSPTISGSLYTFSGAMVGYSPISPTSFTITNSGAGAAAGLAVALSGTNAGSFTLDTTGINAALPGSGATTSFTVKPNDGLSAGTYNATVTISGNFTSYTFALRFVVSTPVNASISPTATEFDLNPAGFSYKDTVVTLTPGSFTLTNITDGGGAVLTAGSDYSVSGNVYTFKTSYLETLGTGNQTFNFNMSGGTSPLALTVKVIDTTTALTLLSGQTNTWVGASDGDAVWTIDGEYSDFIRLLFNGQEVATGGDILVTSGSTIITFKASYLAGFSNGTYNYVAEFANGHANITLVVNKASGVSAGGAGGTSGTGTGDDFAIAGWTTIIILSAFGILYLMGQRKRFQKENAQE